MTDTRTPQQQYNDTEAAYQAMKRLDRERKERTRMAAIQAMWREFGPVEAATRRRRFRDNVPLYPQQRGNRLTQLNAEGRLLARVK